MLGRAVSTKWVADPPGVSHRRRNGNPWSLWFQYTAYARPLASTAGAPWVLPGPGQVTLDTRVSGTAGPACGRGSVLPVDGSDKQDTYMQKEVVCLRAREQVGWLRAGGRSLGSRHSVRGFVKEWIEELEGKQTRPGQHVPSLIGAVHATPNGCRAVRRSCVSSTHGDEHHCQGVHMPLHWHTKAGKVGVAQDASCDLERNRVPEGSPSLHNGTGCSP